jgi:hypothetical protein
VIGIKPTLALWMSTGVLAAKASIAFASGKTSDTALTNAALPMALIIARRVALKGNTARTTALSTALRHSSSSELAALESFLAPVQAAATIAVIQSAVVIIA